MNLGAEVKTYEEEARCGEVRKGGGKTEEEKEWLQVSLGPVRWYRCHKHVLSIFSAFSAHSPECEWGGGPGGGQMRRGMRGVEQDESGKVQTKKKKHRSEC